MPGNVAEAIAAGGEVPVERDGRVVACLRRGGRRRAGLRELARDRLGAPPLDEDWERDLAIAAGYLNQKVEPRYWVTEEAAADP